MVHSSVYDLLMSYVKITKVYKFMEGVKVNKHFYQKFVASALALIMFLGIFAGVDTVKAEAGLNVNADGAIMVDGETGRVLYQKNADSPLGIASMTKMMTEYLVLEAIENGEITWETTTKISD